MNFDQATTKLRELQRGLVGVNLAKRIDKLFVRLAINPDPYHIALLCERVQKMDNYYSPDNIRSIKALCNDLGIPSA